MTIFLSRAVQKEFYYGTLHTALISVISAAEEQASLTL